jgi:hypothetical protein
MTTTHTQTASKERTMNTSTASPFLTVEEIASMPQGNDACKTTKATIYYSIAYFDHNVFKAICGGVSNAPLSWWVANTAKEHPGCEIRVSLEYIANRVNRDGTPFIG